MINPDFIFNSSFIAQEIGQQSWPTHTLYIVPTPIGNIGDISLRALHVLNLVDAIACEDTRNTQLLLKRYGISKNLIAAHQHNENSIANNLINRLQSGERIALVSDAGTPAVSDPGARIVDKVRNAGFPIVPLPGACAALTALSASGLRHDSFYFVGFLPAKLQQRTTVLSKLRPLAATLVFYEAPHRIIEMIQSLTDIFEPVRQIVLARELTKLFEEIHQCPLHGAANWLHENVHRQKGEFVILLEGAPDLNQEEEPEATRILKILLTACSLKQAVALAASITGQKKNTLYERALKITQAMENPVIF